ncbi:hypothetical protein EDB85DRAFT_1881603 [Lactarius pseudohatsudake]|nr:hypothetical protein EDB85DRAFT_1881603 [Lactarius pseudohatsudake]
MCTSLVSLTHPRHLNPYLHTSGRDSHPLTPTSGWDRSAMRWSWELCSRSFASVVKELDDDLTRMVSIFFTCHHCHSSLTRN